jgi:hypothetical protein
MLIRFSWTLLTTSVFVFFTNISLAQKADTSFRLLWYKGKKINDTTLVRKTGETITWSPTTGNVSVGYPAGGEPNASFRNGLAQLEASKIEADRIIASSTPDGSMRSPGVVAEMNRAFDHAAADITRLIQNEFSTGPSPELEYGNKLQKRIRELPVKVRQEYEEVIEYLNKRDQGNAFAIKQPPSINFEYCYTCDSAKQKKFDDESSAFANSFISEEKAHFDKAIHVMRFIGLMQSPSGSDSLFTLKIIEDMNHAMEVISKKIEKKCIDVWNTYKNQNEKVPFLVQFLMSNEKLMALQGISTLPEYPDPGELSRRLFDAVLKIVKEAEASSNYKILLNEGEILYLFKFAEMIGITQEVFREGIAEYMTISRFKVTVDAEAKIEGNGVSQMAKLHYEGPFDAHIDTKNGKCELRWSPYGIDTAKGLVFELREIEMKVPKQTITYYGTRDFSSRRPTIKLDFCDGSDNEIIFYPFFPIDGTELWKIGNVENYPHPLVNTTFLICFLDQEAMRKKAEEFKDTANISAWQKQLTETYQQKIIPNVSVLGKDVADMLPKDYEKGEELMKATDEIIQKDRSPVYFFQVKGKLKNNSHVIFDEVLDGKNVSHYANIVFATFHVKIEHIQQ